MPGPLDRMYELQVGGTHSRILSMEGLRGVAVFFVFLVHYDAAFAPWIVPESATFKLSKFLWAIGFTGVDLFFLLSGYLIYGTVISKPVAYGRFIWRRIQRIYPTFIAIFTLYVALSIAMPARNKIPPGAWDGAVYLVQNFLLLPGMFDIQPLISVAWSLSYEFFFYLTIPLLVSGLAMRRWAPRRRIVFLATLTVAYTAYCLVGPAPRIRLIMFVAGMILFERLRWGTSEPLLRGLPLLATVGGLVSVGALLTRARDLFTLDAGVLANGAVYGTVFLFVAYFLWCDEALRDDRGGFLHTPLLRYLGNMSYSYYLIHGLTTNTVALALTFVITTQTLSPVAYWVLIVPVFAATWVVSTVLFVAIEKPLSLTRKVAT